MSESQNIEYKSSWRDEYLKWICGFANAQGGKLYIGVDDNGNVCGVADSKRLMEDIPNKVRDALGLVVDVDLIKKNGLDVVRISVDEKIGFFENDADLRYQDEVQGSLMIQADRVIDLLYTKYLTAEISYDNVTRIERYPFPKDAIREAVFNALIHQDFSVGVPVQISVYKDKLYISNDCVFPANWTTETLFQKHRSLPHNPDIAYTFFRAGFVESWGRGVEKICRLCKEHGIPEPEYMVHSNDIMMLFRTKNPGLHGRDQENVQEKSRASVIIDFIRADSSISLRKLSKKLGVSSKTVQHEIEKLKAKNVIRRVGGDKGGHWEIG